jgi:hypothetical protein
MQIVKNANCKLQIVAITLVAKVVLPSPIAWSAKGKRQKAEAKKWIFKSHLKT